MAANLGNHRRILRPRYIPQQPVEKLLAMVAEAAVVAVAAMLALVAVPADVE